VLVGLAGGGTITDNGKEALWMFGRYIIPVYVGAWVWSMIDAPLSARSINKNKILLTHTVPHITIMNGGNQYRSLAYGFSLKLNF
jgi:hypothetical protein